MCDAPERSPECLMVGYSEMTCVTFLGFGQYMK